MNKWEIEEEENIENLPKRFLVELPSGNTGLFIREADNSVVYFGYGEGAFIVILNRFVFTSKKFNWVYTKDEILCNLDSHWNFIKEV